MTNHSKTSDQSGGEVEQECFCGGERDDWEYHHPDGCAEKPLATDLAALQRSSPQEGGS